MRTVTRGILALLALALIGLVGCSDDKSTSPDNNNGSGSVDLSSATIAVPPAMAAAAGSNSGAAQAQSYLQLLNSFSSFTAYLQPPASAAAKMTANGVYTWTDGGLTIKLTIQDTGSEIYWDVVLNGTEGQNTYTDFTLLDGYREKTVSSGMLNLYAPDKQNNPVAYWSWSTDPEGVFTSSYFMLSENVVINASVQVSGAGSVAYYVSNKVSFGANWNADGSGTFATYDSNGAETGSGSWPA